MEFIALNGIVPRVRRVRTSRSVKIEAANIFTVWQANIVPIGAINTAIYGKEIVVLRRDIRPPCAVS
jgi:hypothetical protein